MPAVLPPEFVMLCASLFSLYNAGFVVLSCKPHFQQQVQQQQHPTTQANYKTHQRNVNINNHTNATDIGDVEFINDQFGESKISSYLYTITPGIGVSTCILPGIDDPWLSGA